MKTIINAYICTVTLAALAIGQVPKKQAKAAPPVQDITASDAAEDPPAFKRKYLVSLTSKPGITLSVECKDFIGERWCTGTLRQLSDERAVYFDLSLLAEKILDPVIAPEVVRISARIKSMDTAYRTSNPGEFKDSNGTRWGKR